MAGARCLAVALLFIVISGQLPAQTPQPPTEADRIKNWQSDLDALVACLKEKHIKPFFRISAESFDAAVLELRKNIPGMTDHEILFAMMKLSAMLGDGHTGVGPGGNRHTVRQYPIGLIHLAEGCFVAAALEPHQDLVGARITAVGNTPIEEAIKRVSTLYAADNEHARMDKARRWLVIGEALAALKLIEDAEKGAYTIVDSKGQTRNVVISPVTPGTRAKTIVGGDRPAGSVLPSRRVQRPRYGHELIDDGRVLYCWYDACADLKDRPVAAWCKEVLELADQKSPARIVIDLRRNSGGNSALLLPLELGLKTRPAYQQKGTVVALIGPTTFSSAMLNALELRQINNAVLIGMPTGGSPNHFGEVKTQTLPHSQWQVQYSTKYFKKTNDGANTVTPDVAAPISAGDFFAGKDAALSAAIAFRP